MSTAGPLSMAPVEARLAAVLEAIPVSARLAPIEGRHGAVTHRARAVDPSGGVIVLRINAEFVLKTGWRWYANATSQDAPA